MIIYKVTNLINGKVYIGQTCHTLEERKARHLQAVKKESNIHFYQAIRKYGEENFVFEEIDEASNKKALNELEKYYIKYYDSIKHGYNMICGGESNTMDNPIVKEKHRKRMQSLETRAKISQTMKKLRAEKGFSDVTRQKISEKLKGNHNFGENHDTRSVGCYCIVDGNEFHFHSYKEAGIWWYENYKPFPYSESLYQHKIKQNIELGYSVYGKEHRIVDNIRWYKEGVIK